MPEEALSSVFGATVLSSMLENGVRTQAQLLRLLEKEGFSRYKPVGVLQLALRSPRCEPKDFPPAFARALKRDERQKERLAMAYAFGQDERLTIDDLLL